MLASKFIEKLTELIKKHGDREIVHGLSTTGYGQPAIDIKYVGERLVDTDNRPTDVFDISLSEESSCTIGSW